MLGSTVLDVAIGMAGTYLLLSFVITAANELLAAIFNSRGRFLWKGILALLPANLAEEVYNHPLVDGLSQSNRPSYIPSRTFALALLDVISGNSGRIAEPNELYAAFDALPDPVKLPLKVLMNEANGDMEAFKTHVEVWFNNSMDRVAGWYKRKTQAILLLLAAGVTVFLNVDSLLLINRLSHDASLRTALVARAEAASKKAETTPDKKPDKPDADSPKPQPDIAQAQDDFVAATQAIEQLNLPIGWVNAAELKAATAEEKGEMAKRILPEGITNQNHPVWYVFRAHFLGWLLTALAISLGAPFWFDVLNRFINIRAAGKSPEEKPKEPKEKPQPLAPGQDPKTS